MFRRIANLFRQDAKIALRHGFHYVILFMALLFVVLINFVVPAQAKLTPTEYFVDLTADTSLTEFLRDQAVAENRILADREELREQVSANPNSIGIIMEGDRAAPRFTVVHQGTESPEILNVLDATLEQVASLLRDPSSPPGSRVQYLRPLAAPIPFNRGLVPIVLVFEVVLLGFILVAVMVFQEKQEGSIRAYQVTPSGILEYIAAKVGVNVILSILYTLLIVPFTLGLGVNYPQLLVIVILTSLLMTLFGLFVSVFFNNITEFLLLAVILILSVFMLPVISYLAPSFAPPYLTWIPAYPVAFGVREILFPTGKIGFLPPLLWLLVLECGFFLAASYWAVGKKLLKEGR